MDISPEKGAPAPKRARAGKAAVPWVEKYRPNSLDDLISHTDIIQTLNRFIFPKNPEQTARLPHLLLYGPPGTGKTSTILAIAKQLFSQKIAWNDHVLELNASDDRGIGVVRNKIVNFVGTKCSVKQGVPDAFHHIKLVILDEADAMTKDAQNALRRIIEKYTKTTRFCLICNYHSKIIPAIQSRCTQFRFSPLSEDQMRHRVNFIIEEEKIDMTDAGRTALLNQAKGDMRRALNVLQSAALAQGDGEIDSDIIYRTTGQASPDEIKAIMEILMNEKPEVALKRLRGIQQDRGIALQDMIEGLHDQLIEYELENGTLANIIQRLAEIEYRLAKGCADDKQLGGLVAAFLFMRESQLSRDNDQVPNIPMYVQRTY